MSDEKFQEKPDWKGKIGQLSDRMTSLFKRSGKDLPEAPHATQETPLPPSDLAGGSPSFESERTLSQMVAATWRNRVSPRLSAFRGKFGGGAGGKGGGEKPPGGGAITLENWRDRFDANTLNWIAILLAILLVTYIGADLTSIVIDRTIPEPPPVRGAGTGEAPRRMRTLQEYQIIATRNLFNSRGLIPGDDLPATPADNNNVPVKTSLPLNLIGTVVLKNELRSIATIEDTSEQRVYPVRVDDEIPGRARIISVEAFRVIFVNPTNGRREFVEIPEDPQANARITLNAPAPKGDAGAVQKVSETQFTVPKTEIDASLAKWDEILTQARAVPHMENGQPAGFMLVQIVPGSIYDKLGLKNRDVLCGVNGEPINDVSKAMELLTLLKTSKSIELCVKRGGKSSNFTYDIR